MDIKKYDFEKSVKSSRIEEIALDSDEINQKYENGSSRVVTETGSYKVALIKDVFTDESTYNLHPDYQRRITWNNAKRSKLIESLIINIPIPPVFLYEYDFDKYEIMDGLQRITAIIDFYNDKFKLSGLEEWRELNGLKYSKLPEKIKEGIGRRQLQFITLLKESAKDEERADTIKRLVFERLNTGGVKLQGQEIRNAIFNGPANKMCIDLSENATFRSLWGIPNPEEFGDLDLDSISERIQNETDEKTLKKLEKHALYKRMNDVELVLRFFAMRHLDELNYALSDFLDDTLISMNKYDETQIAIMKGVFESTISKVEKLFGENAFKFYSNGKWSNPSRVIYDPLMIVVSNISVPDDVELISQIELQTFYESCEESELFDGKHQSKDDIINRIEAFETFIKGKLE